ncbi:MAG: hypothetical protein GX592_08190 [Clostridiales bacterium]|nr:hypothetical protein [Clostridiales bacterium]
MKQNELSPIDITAQPIVPDAGDLAAIMDEMKDMDTLPFGRVQIAAAGAGVFRVTEPGEEEASPATEIVAVILHNHKANALWLNKYGTSEDKQPDCMSMDGETGVVRETGECRSCASCPYNQYGSADSGTGRGKACKNTRRLYLMRHGDVFPMILHLPSTALAAFDKYRTKVMLQKQRLTGVITRIRLKNAANKDGIAYSTPVFEAIAVLPSEEAARVRKYADGFIAAINGMTTQQTGGMSAACTAVESGFVDVDDEELPFN